MDKSQPGHENRRRSLRKAGKRSTRVRCYGPMGLGPNLAVKTLNLSQNGIRLILNKEMPVGKELEIHLESVCHLRPLRCLAEVVWCEPDEEGNFVVGATFQKPLPYKELYFM